VLGFVVDVFRAGPRKRKLSLLLTTAALEEGSRRAEFEDVRRVIVLLRRCRGRLVGLDPSNSDG
jgi:hypothetical protein